MDGWKEGSREKKKSGDRKNGGQFQVMFVIAEVMYELMEVKCTGFPEMLSN